MVSLCGVKVLLYLLYLMLVLATEGKNKIIKEHRQVLMSIVKELVYAE